MKYRIYVLSTNTDLPIGELTKQLIIRGKSAAVTVTLRRREQVGGC